MTSEYDSNIWSARLFSSGSDIPCDDIAGESGSVFPPGSDDVTSSTSTLAGEMDDPEVIPDTDDRNCDKKIKENLMFKTEVIRLTLLKTQRRVLMTK